VAPDDATKGAPAARRAARAYARGRQSAENGGALFPRANDVKVLREREEHCARLEHARGTYSPDSNPDDAVREQNYQEKRAERAELIEQQRYAIAHLRQKKLAAASSAPVPAEPAVPYAFVAVAVSVFALTLVPTLHDFLFLTLPVRAAWALSIGCAGAIGLFVTWAVVGLVHDSSGEDSHFGVAGALVLTLGLTLLRLSSADGRGEYIFTAGLTMLEAGVLVYLESVAGTMRRQYARYEAAVHRASTDQKEIEILDHEVGRINELLAEVDSENRAHADYLTLRHTPADAASRAAGSAAESGYLEAVARTRRSVVNGDRS